MRQVILFTCHEEVVERCGGRTRPERGRTVVCTRLDCVLLARNLFSLGFFPRCFLFSSRPTRALSICREFTPRAATIAAPVERCFT